MSKLNISAKEALAELKAVIAEVKELKAEVEKIKGSTPDTFKNLEDSIKKLRRQIGLLGNRMNYLEAIIRKQTQSTNTNTTSTNKNTTSTKSNTTAVEKNTETKNKNANSSNNIVKSNKKLGASLKNLFKIFGLFTGLQFLRQIGINIFENIKTFDSLSFALERVTQNVNDYNDSQRFLLSLTADYGIELVTTTNRWIKFLAAARNAGLTLEDTQNIFRSMTKAAGVLGLKTDELQGIYLALEQMLSKGKVTTEELRRQLGERLPGAMGIMAASIGVTIPKLDEMLRKGEVLSADVLPKFADAVEIAFGIENVEKIDTIVAAQNRAIASWQNFIRILGGSEGFINKVLRRIINAFTDLSNRITFLISGDAEQLQQIQVEEEKVLSKRLTAWAKERLSKQKEFAGLEQKLRAEIVSETDKLNRTSNQDERQKLQAHLDDLNSQLVKYGQTVKGVRKQIATEAFDDALNRFEEVEALYNRGIQAANEAEEEQFGEYNALQRFIRSSAIKQARDKAFLKETGQIQEALKVQYVQAASAFNVYRKLIEQSNVEVPEDDKPKGRKPRTLELKEILDLEKQIRVQILKNQVQSNQELINNDEILFIDRIELQKRNGDLLNQIADLNFKIEVDRARKAKNEKLRVIEKAEKDGAIIIGDVEQQKIDIQKEFDQKVIIADEKKNNAILKNRERTDDAILKSIEDINKQFLASVQDPYNIEIAKIKEVYNASKKTKKDREQLEKSLRRVAVEAANAQIDAQITLLKAQIANGDASQDQIDAMIMKINELESLKQVLITAPDDTDENFWDKLLDTVRDYASAIGDLFDAIYSRRIENIEAEMDAEERKYDKLIELAEGDAAQQEVLERNKQERIAALEKKRLKEQQKQARARKAFAVVDIAVSTAQAIMRAYADTGPISGTVWAAILGALGAVQIAAVLAQPIPKYKDGGEIKKNEIAMINDGISKEYVKRDGQILSTDTKNAVVALKKDDIVYKNYDEMINKELLQPNGIKTIGINENEFNHMFMRFEDSIEKGFKKAKINTVVNVINKQDSSHYAESMRW